MLTSEDFYVFSRIDGTATFRDLILMMGRGPDYTASLLLKLRAVGAFLLGDETPASLAATLPTPESQSELDIELSADEEQAMFEDVVLSDAEKRYILVTMRSVVAGDPRRILGVESDADLKALKSAHRRVSKRFHPDRYYGKNTGSFGPLLSEIFEAATKAWGLLSAEAKRGTGGTGAQSRKEHAAQLFQEGVQEQGQGNLERALALLAGAARTFESPRYLRRVASCALEAGQLEQAEDYARRGVAMKPDDPSYLRVLATVLRGGGRLPEAEEVLALAAEIRTENDVLAAEIASDLEAIRRLL